MPNLFIQIYQIYDFKTHFVGNIFKWARAHFFFAQSKFHLFLFNTNNSVYYQSFLCTQFNVFKYCYISPVTQTIIYTQLNDPTVLFQAIQFRISIQFACQTVLFDPLIGPYQVLIFWTTVDVGAMTMKGNSTFPKAPALLKRHHQIV